MPVSAADDLIYIFRQRVDHDLLAFVSSLHGAAENYPMRHALVGSQTLASSVIDDAIIRFDPEVRRCHLTVKLHLPHHYPIRNTFLGQTRDDQTARSIAFALNSIQVVEKVL